MTLPTDALATNSEIVHALFDRVHFANSSPLGYGGLATVENPAQGFEPFRIGNTEVLWVSNPWQLPAPLAYEAALHWKNSLGLVIFRNPDANVVGAVAVHSARRNSWNSIQPGAWQALGGVMAFSGTSFEEAIAKVLDKAYAMTPKWEFIRELGLGDPELGGAKSIVLHGPTIEEKRNALQVAVSVFKAIGIYIGGPDQNTGFEEETGINWSNEIAAQAGFNFMGSSTGPENYRGLGNPSPLTAFGVYTGLFYVEKKLGGNLPVFIQGHGGTGSELLKLLIRDEIPVSGVSDALVKRLVRAREVAQQASLNFPVILDAQATLAEFNLKKRDEEILKAREAGILIAEGPIAALRFANGTKIYSPNAGPHVIDDDWITYAHQAGIVAGIGATNNVLAYRDGSSEAIARRLVALGIFLFNDSWLNKGGAAAVLAKVLGFSGEQLKQALSTNIPVGGEKQWQAHIRNVSPQLLMDFLIAMACNSHLRGRERRAISGFMDVEDPGIDRIPSQSGTTGSHTGEHPADHQGQGSNGDGAEKHP